MGAVLYVMLVARFPEFHKHDNGSIELKLPAPLWAQKSEEARSLVKVLMLLLLMMWCGVLYCIILYCTVLHCYQCSILILCFFLPTLLLPVPPPQGLMCYNPNSRLTARQALAHPWLGAFAIALPNALPKALPPAGPSTPNSQFRSTPNSLPDSVPSAAFSTPPNYQHPSDMSDMSTSMLSSSQPRGKGQRSNSNDVLDMVLYPHYNANIQGKTYIVVVHYDVCDSYLYVIFKHISATLRYFLDQLSASKNSSPAISINIPPHQTPPQAPYDGNNYALTTNNVNNLHVSNLSLSPLLALQRNIATCFEEVHNSYYNHPALSTQVVIYLLFNGLVSI
jgi:serine/threonine protein kinase